MPCWDTDKGDLSININGIFRTLLEVKGFMSSGPTSFGPNECWDKIYFVDAHDCKNKNFKVYEVKLSNKNKIFRQIKISGKDFLNEDIPPIPDNLETYTKDNLKVLCEKRGLTKNGNKTDLIKRIKEENIGSKFKQPKTYGEIADNNRRGQLRACFHSIIKPQLGEHCKLIFDGNISKLNNTITK
jgi:hypothetical protein